VDDQHGQRISGFRQARLKRKQVLNSKRNTGKQTEAGTSRTQNKRKRNTSNQSEASTSRAQIKRKRNSESGTSKAHNKRNSSDNIYNKHARRLTDG
jgi:hypothetical protein